MKILVVSMALMLGLLSLGCGQERAPVPTSHVNASDWAVLDKPEDIRFRRVYTKPLRPGVFVTFEVQSFLGRRFNGTIRQDDGKWVTFDPERPAERILDASLIPLLERAFEEARDMDTRYLNEPPQMIQDENGVVWRRAK